jgi:hypothetical protein
LFTHVGIVSSIGKFSIRNVNSVDRFSRRDHLEDTFPLQFGMAASTLRTPIR